VSSWLEEASNLNPVDYWDWQETERISESQDGLERLAPMGWKGQADRKISQVAPGNEDTFVLQEFKVIHASTTEEERNTGECISALLAQSPSDCFWVNTFQLDSGQTTALKSTQAGEESTKKEDFLDYENA